MLEIEVNRRHVPFEESKKLIGSTNPYLQEVLATFKLESGRQGELRILYDSVHDQLYRVKISDSHPAPEHPLDYLRQYFKGIHDYFFGGPSFNPGEVREVLSTLGRHNVPSQVIERARDSIQGQLPNPQERKRLKP